MSLRPMTDVLQPTQSGVESVPSTSTSTLSNTSSLKSPLKSNVANENKISAPAGREIINLSRRTLYIGRAGAGNAMSSQPTQDRQQKVRELLARDREVLESYKAQVPINYNTGRGGAGAKGHIKVKGKVPNRERALAKEREVRAKWREERDKNSSLKTGRGGRGNIMKVTSSDDTSSMGPSRVESRDSSLNVGRPLSAFGTTGSEKVRRRHFSLHHKPSSSRPGSSQSYYAAQDDSRAPSSATNRWDPTSDTDSCHGLESAGIMTSKVDPLALVGSQDSDRSATPTIVGSRHVFNGVARVEERTHPRRLRKLPLKIGHKPSLESSSSTTTISPHSNSLLRPFKKLHIPKTHEIESIPASVVIEISASSTSAHHYPEPPVSSNIDASTFVYPYRTDWTTAPNAMQMGSPSHRGFIRPSRILTPPPPPAPPTTPAQRSLSEDLESVTETGYESSPTSDTFGSITTHANQSFLSTNTSTPVRSAPPRLPALYFQEESIPPRGTGIRWSKRPLPTPPVSSLFSQTEPRPLSTHSGLPSPPETPLGAEFGSGSVTPTSSPSSYHTARLPPSPFSYSPPL